MKAPKHRLVIFPRLLDADAESGRLARSGENRIAPETEPHRAKNRAQGRRMGRAKVRSLASSNKYQLSIQNSQYNTEIAHCWLGRMAGHLGMHTGEAAAAIAGRWSGAVAEKPEEVEGPSTAPFRETP
jgi:hypothetical protein